MGRKCEGVGSTFFFTIPLTPQLQPNTMREERACDAVSEGDLALLTLTAAMYIRHTTPTSVSLFLFLARIPNRSI